MEKYKPREVFVDLDKLARIAPELGSSTLKRLLIDIEGISSEEIKKQGVELISSELESRDE